jgi:hypothetical protein
VNFFSGIISERKKHNNPPERTGKYLTLRWPHMPFENCLLVKNKNFSGPVEILKENNNFLLGSLACGASAPAARASPNCDILARMLMKTTEKWGRGGAPHNYPLGPTGSH